MWYVLQGPGSVWDSLVQQPAAWPGARVEAELLPRVGAIPAVLAAAKDNLLYSGAAIKNHGLIALATMGCPAAAAAAAAGGCTLGSALAKALAAVGDAASPAVATELRAAGVAASAAIDEYGSWLGQAVHSFAGNASVGEAAYLWYHNHAAMSLGVTPGRIADYGRAEYAAAAASLANDRHRNDVAGLGPLPLLPTLAAQAAATLAAQAEVKAYAAAQQLFTVPDWLPNYTVSPIPAWLQPFDYSQLGEEDDFTTPPESLAGVDFTRYIPAPTPGMPLFLDAMARDPRSVIVHEGLPGHWMQFSVSWRNPREARRRWIDR